MSQEYVKDFDEWNVCKKQIETRSKFIGFKEREVWFAAIGINVGHEQDGKNGFFERPVLVLKRFNKDMLMAIPLSTKIKDDPNYIPFIFGGKMRSAVISQARLIDARRLLRKIFTLPQDSFEQIRNDFIGLFQTQKSDPAVARSSEPEGYSALSISKSDKKVNSKIHNKAKPPVKPGESRRTIVRLYPNDSKSDLKSQALSEKNSRGDKK